MSSYPRVKKHRFVQKGDCSSVQSTSILQPHDDVDENLMEYETSTTTDDASCETAQDIVTNQIELFNESEEQVLVESDGDDNPIHQQDLREEHHGEEPSLVDDLRAWALRNITNLKNKTITELLQLLGNHGHANLPKTAETLLKTRRTDQNMIRPMESIRSYGKFVYIGIKTQLERQINPDIFVEDRIDVLISIDGMPIYKNSNMQFWPILMKVYCSDKYRSNPFVVALYCGDSKPNSTNEYLDELVEEAILLTENGINILGKHYEFKIKAFICDTPARAFIKCIKQHGGFSACERCTVRGVSLNFRRVYARSDCPLRTHESFRQKCDPAQHAPDIDSPLLRIPGFDIVRSVVLDIMHLLFLGVMKSLLCKWKSGNPLSRLSVDNRIELGIRLAALEPHVPTEFQRKTFDLSNVGNWKATSYRFVLLYGGPLVVKGLVTEDKFKHFLLLHTACRVMCSSHQTAVAMADYAKTLLCKFFDLLPTLYGTNSQVMNFHNLIHVADDVQYLGGSLSYFTAFPFENTLGQIKRLIRTPNLPLSQVCRRLSELEASAGVVQPQLHLQTKCDLKTDFEDLNQGDVEYDKITLKNMTITTRHPDNLVILKNGDHLEVNKIFFTVRFASKRISDLQITGCKIITNGNAFVYPCESSNIGVYVLGNKAGEKTTLPFLKVKSKCVHFMLHDINYSVELLHECN